MVKLGKGWWKPSFFSFMLVPFFSVFPHFSKNDSVRLDFTELDFEKGCHIRDFESTPSRVGAYPEERGIYVSGERWTFRGMPPLPAKRESEGLAPRHCLPNEKVKVWHAAIACLTRK